MRQTVVPSDKELLERYRAGDSNAISGLIERHRKRVRDYVYMMVKDSDLADDISQETFIKVVRVIDEDRYTDNGKFLSWVLRIAHNRVLDYFRASRTQNTIGESETGYDILGNHSLAEDNVEDKMVASQIEADVRRLVEQLPDEQRDVVQMRYYEGLSFKEIADKTDVSINTALGRMRYALINLRKMIKDNQIILA